jgi:hypothetical protein
LEQAGNLENITGLVDISYGMLFERIQVFQHQKLLAIITAFRGLELG